MSAQFGTALDMLARGRYVQAHNLAGVLARARPPGATDLNSDFTNTAMSMCVMAVARAAQGAELMNASPDAPSNRVRAHNLFRDALDDITECLDSKTMIVPSARSGAGISLRDNLALIMRSLLDMQQAIAGYAAHNPTEAPL
jgi:hypothetical protein